MRGRTSFEHSLEFLKFDNADERLANLGHLHMVGGGHLDKALCFEPVAKRAHRASITIDGALGELFPLCPRFRTHVREPGEDMHALDVLDRGHPLPFQEISEVPERERMPFNGLGTMVLTTMVENVLLNSRAESTFCTSRERLPVREDDFAGAACSCFLREESKDTGTPPMQERHSQEKQVLAPFLTFYDPQTRQVRMGFGGRHSQKHM
jgi:hypothetical protein